MIDRTGLAKLASVLGGLPVLACRAGSPAACAGIRYGDIVIAVNGVPTPDLATFLEARSMDAATMKLVLFRDGIHLEIDIELTASEPVDPLNPPTLLAERIVRLEASLKPRRSEKPN